MLLKSLSTWLAILRENETERWIINRHTFHPHFGFSSHWSFYRHLKECQKNTVFPLKWPFLTSPFRYSNRWWGFLAFDIETTKKFFSRGKSSFLVVARVAGTLENTLLSLPRAFDVLAGAEKVWFSSFVEEERTSIGQCIFQVKISTVV